MEPESDFPDYLLPHSSEQFLLRLEAQRHRLMETLRALSDEQLVTPLDAEGWSVKDHVAHLTAWEAGIVALLKYQDRWRAMGLAPSLMADALDYEEINAELYRQHRSVSPGDAFTAFNRVHIELVHLIQTVGTEGIHKSYAHYAPDAAGEEWEEPVINWLIGNSYGHYAEHLQWIEEKVAARGW